MTRHVAPGCAIWLLAMSCLGGSLVAATEAPTSPSARPDWCRPGFVCLPTRDAADLTIRLADLEADLAASKAARVSRWGWVAGCGPSASLQAQNSKWDVAGTISCTVGLGVKIGR